MKKSIVAALVLVAVTLSSCGFTTTCPTYAKKPVKNTIGKETRI